MFTTICLVTAAWSQAAAPVSSDEPAPVSFEFELLPALTQAGCNGGACHGSPNGRGGFAMSLFAYDPEADYETLVTGGLGRRIDLIEPGASLLLRKPLGEMSHGGGVRLAEGDIGLDIIKRWIQEGARGPEANGVRLDRLEILPEGPVLRTFPEVEEPLTATAYLSNGETLDVTSLVSWFSTNDGIAEVDAFGSVTGKGRGQCAIVARYLDQLVSVPFVFVQPVDGYEWPELDEYNFVDELVNERLRELQYFPMQTCDDATFLRRVTLDLTGLLPEHYYVKKFLEFGAEDKRARMIEQLLASDEHAAFWANKDADLLRLTRANLKEAAEPYATLLRDSWRSNQPYDELVRGLLTAEGAGAAYYQALPDATTRIEATTQVFLGSRLECAKCHNHPYEGWTQDDYYRIATNFSDGVVHARTKQGIAPWAGETSAPLDERRAAFADWLTHEDERFFARVQVNRIWAELMGRGIVEPVDDFRSSNPPSNEALLDALAKDFVASGYDRRHTLRTILNSQVYQRMSEPRENDEPDIELFSRQRRRLLSAEQISDAVKRVASEGERAQLIGGAMLGRAVASQRAREIDDEFSDWVNRTRASLEESREAALGPWQITEIFEAPDAFEHDFGVEEFTSDPLGVQGLTWTEHTEWEDGVVHPLKMPGNSAVYLTRTVRCAAAHTLTFSLGSDDGLRLWVAGKEVLTRKVSRGAAPGQDTVTVPMPAGASSILLKIWNGGGAAGFCFSAGEVVDVRLMELLEMEAGPGLDAAQEKELRDRHRSGDDEWRQTTEYLAETESKIDRWFASLRLVQDAGDQKAESERITFLRAFGEPARATSCACERSKEPTLAQALQMLNGAYVGSMVRAAAERFRPMRTGVDDLYLAVFARYPTSHERDTVNAYLDGGDVARWEDLVWALLNTQEFLFQH